MSRSERGALCSEFKFLSFFGYFLTAVRVDLLSIMVVVSRCAPSIMLKTGRSCCGFSLDL